MKFDTLEVSINHRVAVIWLAREAVRNAFNEVSIAELTAAFNQFGQDDAVRAIVLAPRGLSRVGSVLLGSVSSGVAYHCRRPLLVIPPRAGDGDAPAPGA